ncbi:MAG: hypothetical protein P8Z50_01885 [candidate division WOR-3 bacterium]
MKNNQALNLVSAITLAVLAILTFCLQIFSGIFVTKNEVALINVLQFIMSVGFTWQAAKYFNYESFSKSLKKYAISAYRRISDIHSIVSRLRKRTVQMILEPQTTEERHELQTVVEIARDAELVIMSSIADWSEIIGEEISTFQSIKELESKRAQLETAGPTVEKPGANITKIDEIQNKIEKLRKRLPVELRYGTITHFDSDYSFALAANWLAGKHIDEKGLHVLVVTGGTYGNLEEAMKLKIGDECTTIARNRGLEVYSQNQAHIGRMLNNSPFDYPDFMLLLHHLFSTELLTLNYFRIIKTWKRDDVDMAHLEFTINNPLTEVFASMAAIKRGRK